MKVLLLCWRDTDHPQGGGSERYLERVGEYLASRGHDVVYRTAAYRGAPTTEHRNGMRFIRRGGKFTVYLSAWIDMLCGRLGLGAFSGVDVAVDTQNGIPFFAGPASGVPTVLLTHHCHREQWPVAGPLIARLGWFIESRLAPWCYRTSAYVTVSKPSRDELLELGVRDEQISIISNGIDPIPFAVQSINPDGRTHLVTLSRLVPHKQIEHALNTVAALRDRHNDVVLDVIGSGWWEDELKEHARSLGLGQRVIFHGQVSEEKKHALLANAALHLMPSRKEGWGLAVIEAAQHGVPTVGYRNSGGLRDSVSDGVSGLLVEDEQGFYGAVEKLLDDPHLRANMGQQARAGIAHIGWEVTGAAFEELLRKIR